MTGEEQTKADTEVVEPNPLNGRRLLNKELQATWRLIAWDKESPMLRARMAPRRMRRMIQGKHFRPVYGYLGPIEEVFVP